MSALIGPEGRKSGVRSYYFHLEPDGASMLAGGLHSPEPGQLAAVRDAIGRDSKPLKRILSAPTSPACSGRSRERGSRPLRRDTPKIIPTSGSGDVVGRAIEAFSAMRPFLAWLEGAVS
jgi:hypothetical protein